MQTQSSADRITTSLSFAHRRGEKQLSSNLTLYKLTQATGPTLGEQKPKEREFNPEAWEKKTADTISLKKKKWKGREILHKWRNKLEKQKFK